MGTEMRMEKGKGIRMIFLMGIEMEMVMKRGMRTEMGMLWDQQC